MNTALVTGASSGIGYELAKLLAENGHNLVLVARDAKRLAVVAEELREASGVDIKTFTLDLSEQGAAKQLHTKLKATPIDILINNAGVGLKGNFFDDALLDNQKMAYLNMNSLMVMTHYFGNEMLKRRSGKILNIASIAAFFPGPKQPVYYATKSFVRSFSRALAYNLRDSGVSVTVLHPGPTRTSFFKNAKAGTFHGGASARSVAQLGYKAMMEGKIEVTHGFRNKILANFFVRIVPSRLQPQIVDKASEV